jgi:hypothetical protein
MARVNSELSTKDMVEGRVDFFYFVFVGERGR